MPTRRSVLLGAGELSFAVLTAGALLVPRHRLEAAAQVLTGPVNPPELMAAQSFAVAESWAAKLISAAESQIGKTVTYDPAYMRLSFPMGDVPRERGVCTDVIVRAYRDAFGIDLQELVHKDMRKAFGAYPKIWGLKRPDPNIDHRRVLNLEKFFTRAKASLGVSDDGKDYKPGDIVTQRLPNNLPHMVIVTHRASRDGKRPLVVHNIGAGTRLEDRLFDFKIVGHFRFAPKQA